MTLLRPGQIAPEGAADGDVLSWSDSANAWVPAAPSGGGGGGGSGPAPLLCMPQGTVARQYLFTSTVESWTNDAGTMTATGGKLRITNNVNINVTALEPSGASSVPDGELWADVECVTADGAGRGTFGLVFRAADANNHYMWGIDFAGTGTFNLYKKVSGTYTSVRAFTWDGYLPAPGWGRFMTRFVGSQLELWCNETLVTAVRDTTFTTGRCGVRAGSTTSSSTIDFDNVTVLSLASGWRPPSY